MFNGFEATAIYRDEVKRPSITIPRATFLAVAFLGIFYAISAFALILSTGTSNAVAAAQADPTAMMPDALLRYFGAFANQVIAILLVTSFFASGLSLQNILSRYTHSLAVDGIFPQVDLGSPCEAWVSASRRSGSRCCLCCLVLLILVLSGGDANSLYAAAAGVAFYGMLLLLCLTAVAIIVYFRRNKSPYVVLADAGCPCRRSRRDWVCFVDSFLQYGAARGRAIQLLLTDSAFDSLLVDRRRRLRLPS